MDLLIVKNIFSHQINRQCLTPKVSIRLTWQKKKKVVRLTFTSRRSVTYIDSNFFFLFLSLFLIVLF